MSETKEINERLTTKEYWANVWEGVKLPDVRVPTGDTEQVLRKFLPQNKRLIEVGCAPGGWMAYYHQNFGYSVDGIEYVPDAAELTKANMKCLGIDDATIWCEDFFSIDTADYDYDVVFSAGFIEHFDDFTGVCGRLADVGRIVVTVIPNLFGVNGLISRKVRPHVYDKHVLINLQKLREAHEANGLKTQFCNYVGGAQFFRLTDRNKFFQNRTGLAKCVDLPVRAFNRFSRFANQRLMFRPRACWCCPSLMYIGTR